jgi:hypothetical protein
MRAAISNCSNSKLRTKNQKPKTKPAMTLFTIGHSNHSIEVFINLLKLHDVTALVDVRSHPYSRYLPHFNKASLQAALHDAGIHYVFLGQQLGARPNDSNCYVAGKAVYEKIAATEVFVAGIQHVTKAAETSTIALMCAEKDPITCHRAILICQYLREFPLKIRHILSNGDLETHIQLEERLLELHGFKAPELGEQQQLSLFNDLWLFEKPAQPADDKIALNMAYQRQGDRIAYTEKIENT